MLVSRLRRASLKRRVREACLITDKWRGIEEFFEPGREILVAESAEEIVGYLRGKSAAEARAIGEAMRRARWPNIPMRNAPTRWRRFCCAARADRHPSALDPVMLQTRPRESA